ncbi:glycosyltransferase family 2 protein [Flavobacterium sp. SORGH_AS_0622]|jgi:glycosyltransferase involved in cell wall biosynthesis|uniref:glycosyltransferase family 2 protein n=1 Tax=Flavobacterium sp. SORGH_AS_0622 TaxID=3041772 RepID=UPI0027836E00|nr:glycosyltransferase family 2 protein [Flavobacterium sp. SORGH_AS_0622]MDQ1167510.1 glycosyltransferase involved in cell wall biosynthesis [Flavobacterium sp. SORGH_AS_0622]
MKVTIGIPFYNAEKYLQDAVLSVINQTYKNWNLILLDDGSKDNSLHIAKSFANERISVVSDGMNKGLVYRLNQIVELADGDYYARMDADDIMHFERLEKQVNYLQNNPDADVVGSSYYAIDSDNSILGFRKANLNPESINDIFKNGCFAHPSIIGKLNWFKNNKYDGAWERMEDLELWIRTFPKSKFINLEEPLLFYRVFGIPVLKKYLKSNFGIIRLLQKRKKYSISLYSSIYFSILFFLKIIVYCILDLLGKVDVVLKNRFSILDDNQSRDAKEKLLKSIAK